MAFQLSPGVLVTEEDRTAVVPSVATTAGAFSGAFQWGPVSEVTTVDTETNLVDIFGKPNDTTAGYFFTAANFLSYGNNLKIVRAVNKSVARNAVSNPSGSVTSVTINSSANTFTAASPVTVTFSSPGTGTTAQGNAVLSSTGTLLAVNMATRGFGYNTPPVITFEDGGGSGATATAYLGVGEVADIVVQTAGNNYSNSSNIVIQNQDSTGASASLVVHYKLLDLLSIANGGTNYDATSNIQFTGNIVAGGNHAQAILALDGSGTITGFVISNSGNGYLSAPNVIINRNDASAGTDATVTANIGYGYIDRVVINDSGAGGYSFTPNVTINRNNLLSGASAEVTARMEAQISTILINNPGSGWTSTPNVIITPVVNDRQYVSNARAIATVGYTIDSISVATAGTGYRTVPTITITDDSNSTATATAVLDYLAPLIENTDDYLTNHSSGGFDFGEFAAKYPGALGNSIKVSIADSDSYDAWQYSGQFDGAPSTSAYVAAKGGTDDELHVIVIDANGTWTGSAGTVLEKFSYLSKANDAKNSDQSTNYYKDVINNQSKFIWWLDHNTLGTNWGTTAASKTFTTLTANVTATLSGGVSGDEITSGNVQAGFEAFSNDELYDVSLIPMGPTTNNGVVNAVIGIAESRRDCVVFASPPYVDVVNTTNQASRIATYRDTLTASSYAVLDSGWKYQYDRYNDKYRYVPLNGDVAGLAARTDYIADPWFSPAGYNRGVIKNVVKLAYSPSKTDRDTLYKKGVNPVVTFPGQGTLLFGDKTLLARPSAFDRINVRRLFIVLEKAIATASKFQLFEFNDPFTRAQFRNLVEPFLRDVQGRRGITDFRVICDDTNNSAAVIDRNEFVADIFIKPARSINFIQLNFVATRTGISFDEVGA